MLTTKDMNGQTVLKLFDDGIHIDEKLPKWIHADKYLKEKKEQEKKKKSEKGEEEEAKVYRVLDAGTSTTPDSTSNYFSYQNIPQTFIVYNSADPYELRGDVKFDEIASASLLELTALIKSKELNNILSGYGGMHYSGTNNATIVVNETKEKIEKSTNFIQKALLKLKLARLKKNEKEYEFDVIEFFKSVKLTSKESRETYRDRVSNYLKAIHNAHAIGQVALLEKLVKELIANKFESELYATGNYYVITEEQVLDFAKKTTGKGVELTYIKNFTRPIPEDVVAKLVKANELEVFDNYVIMHYDPKGEAKKPTEKEIAKKKDPILFGVISGSRKLYYIADWIDEYCNLTLEKFVETLDIKKEDLLLDGPKKDEPAPEEPKDDAPKEEKPKKKSGGRKKKKEDGPTGGHMTLDA